MQIIKRGKRVPLSWPFGRNFTCERCECVFVLNPGEDSRAMDVQQTVIDTGIVGIDGRPKQTAALAAITVCPNCGYPCGIVGGAGDVEGTRTNSDESA